MHVKKPAKAGFFYIATNILAKAIGFFSTPVFTRLLSPEEYGVYSLYISWLGILTVVLGLGITSAAVYRALGKFGEREEEFISCTVGVLFLVSASAAAIAFLFGGVVSSLTGLSRYMNFMLVGEVFFNSCEAVIFALKRYKFLYLKICLINLLYAILTPTLAALLIYLTPIRAAARPLSSFFVTAFLILPEIAESVKPKRFFSRSVLSYLLRVSLPLLPSALSMTLIAQSDKLMIERISGSASLAKYSVAYSLGFLITTLTTAVYSALQPWLMRKLNGGDAAGAKAFCERLILLVFAGLAVFLSFAPELFSLIAAPEYRDALSAVYPLAVAGAFQFVSNILSSNIIHNEKTGRLSAVSIFAFLFNLILNIFLIPRFGYIAAALTTAAAYAFLILFEFFLLLGISKQNIIDAKSFRPLLISLYAIPAFFLKSSVPFRILSAVTALIFALPSLIKTSFEIIEGKRRIGHGRTL